MSMLQGMARLGANPELKYVGDGESKQAVCEMRLRFLNSKQDKVTGEWSDDGFWAQVNLWGACAEPAAKLYSKGDRVVVVDGNMVMNSWPDKENEGQMATGLKVDTRLVLPYLADVSVLKFKERSTQAVTDTAGSHQPDDAELAVTV